MSHPKLRRHFRGRGSGQAAHNGMAAIARVPWHKIWKLCLRSRSVRRLLTLHLCDGRGRCLSFSDTRHTRRALSWRRQRQGWKRSVHIIHFPCWPVIPEIVVLAVTLLVFHLHVGLMSPFWHSSLAWNVPVSVFRIPLGLCDSETCNSRRKARRNSRGRGATRQPTTARLSLVFDSGSESGKSHAGGVAVGNLLQQSRIPGYLVPIYLWS